MDLLDYPVFRDLEAENDREQLLYFKAYVEGFEAALQAVEEFGLEEAKVIHQRTKAEVVVRFQEE
ncbi:MAG: hypothetical protein PVF47_05865 [Anaerolineae bacterium]|jgi:hypothetical protein